VRFPTPRLTRLFEMLQNEPLPQDELARRLSVSTRTVRADIAALNALLIRHGAQFVLSRNDGYRLKIDDPDSYRLFSVRQGAVPEIPRTSEERMHCLMVRFLTSAFSLKLEALADEWFVSRATLQNDMAEVRERLGRYQLTLETRPRHGIKLFGRETAIRTCLTDLLWTMSWQAPGSPLAFREALSAGALELLQPILEEIFSRCQIQLTDEGALFLRLYCAVAVRRIGEGYPLSEAISEAVGESVSRAAREIARALQRLTEKPLSAAEESWLQVLIAARQVEERTPGTINADDGEALVNYLLTFVNTRYNYNLLTDRQLRADLLTHVKTMITRVRYQIMIPNPLLENIKQHYPMAWDITLAAVAGWEKYTPYAISENEIGFLALHIGVGLERNYDIGYRRRPSVALVCDAGNAMVRMIEAVLRRKYPQIKLVRALRLRDYERRESIAEDFVISTARIAEKDKPVVTIGPFPTDYQLEQIGRLVLVDRTRPWMLNNYFDAEHFLIVEEEMDRTTLFEKLCGQLQREGFVDAQFLPSVIEREAIVSTMFGDGIALPHALGLLAKKTVVYTVLAPQGIAWGNETARVIFLLAISKNQYEEAMAIYDIFVAFLRDRAVSRLYACRSFEAFQATALACVSRF
jgi:transcriptional antiterminator